MNASFFWGTIQGQGASTEAGRHDRHMDPKLYTMGRQWAET